MMKIVAVNKESRAKAARRLRVESAQGLRSSETSPKKVGVRFGWWKAEPSVAGFAADCGGSVADAFFGASPVVASALGIRSGATPCGRNQTNMPSADLRPKPELLTLHKSGTFHFALTAAAGWGDFTAYL
jgi:hypothetical protein